MQVIEYDPKYKKAIVELLAELQDYERTLSSDRTPGNSMAAGHFDYLLDLCENQSGKVLLALSETKVIGFLTVFLEAEDENDMHLFPEYKRYGWVSDLVVQQKHLGSGAASLLIDHAERHCSSLGVCDVKLAALHKNFRARSFYKKSGYTEYEVIYRKTV